MKESIKENGTVINMHKCSTTCLNSHIYIIVCCQWCIVHKWYTYNVWEEVYKSENDSAM